MIPTTIKIGASQWHVWSADEIEDGAFAICDQDNQTILIRSDLPESLKEEVFVHELLHACCFAVGIEDEERLSEEQFVNRVSVVLQAALRDNGFWPSSTPA